jgi:hypothetical protein
MILQQYSSIVEFSRDTAYTRLCLVTSQLITSQSFLVNLNTPLPTKINILFPVFVKILFYGALQALYCNISPRLFNSPFFMLMIYFTAVART